MALIGSSGNYRQFIIANRKEIFLFAVTILYIGYLFVGGFIFLMIEGPEEAAEKNAVLKAKEAALKKFPNVPGEAIDHFLKELSANGVRGIRTDNTTRWTIGNSVLYAATLLTTIGYGHLSTSSPLGKIVCMIYTSIGIPFTLFVLASYVEKLQMLSDFFLASLFLRLNTRMAPSRIRAVHFSIVMLFIVVGCFLFPAFIFSTLELTWSYLDSVYFCFISLTTVGLGDFVPGLNMKHPLVDLYRFGSTVYMFVGVTIMMFTLSLMTDIVKNLNEPYQEKKPPSVAPEKVSICPDERPPSYGTIIVQVTKTFDDDETKALLP